MDAIDSSSAQSTTRKLSDALGFTELGKLLGIDPVLLMFWTFAGGVCMAHIFLLWWMPPSWVVFFCGQRGIVSLSFGWIATILRSALGFPPKNKKDNSPGWWTRFVTMVEEHRTTSVVWWRILAIFYGLWVMLMAGPYSLIMRLVGNPDTSRLVGMGIVAPIGLATILWTLMNPSVPFLTWAIAKVPSGWIEQPGSTESIVWVTVLVVGGMCGSLEFLHAFYPPIVRLFLGDVPLSLFHAGMLLAAGFACIMAGIEVDGNHVTVAKAETDAAAETDAGADAVAAYQNARTYHLAFLSVSLFAVVVAYLFLPALDRKSFLSEAMRPRFYE